MKTSTTFILLLTAISLFGCNTLITKPISGKTGRDNNAAYQDQKIDLAVNLSDRIDEVPIDKTLSYSKAEPSTRFSIAWKVKGKNEPFTKPFSNGQDTSMNQTAKMVWKPRIGKMNEASKPGLVKKTRRFTQAVSEKKRTDKTLNVEPIIANGITKPTNEASPHHNSISENNDLWDRIRQGYGLQMVYNEQIQRALEEYIQYPSYFQRIANKARPYLYYIVEEIEKRKMPLEIALLPAIESAYEPMALSYKSAAGLWQFIPATGKEYGLTQNAWYDGRRDIINSTNAALDYLQTLYRMFDDDWFLALAAYNYGQGNLKKAIDQNMAREEFTDFWSLRLPKETREYVPKLLALAQIIASPQEYEIKLQPIANQPYLERVNIGQQIDLSLVAQLAGLSSIDLKRLNPCYRRGTTAPNGPHYITLPIDVVPKFKQLIAKIPPQEMLPQTKALEKPVLEKKAPVVSKVVSKPVNLQKHHVRKGDNLWKIAKHYGTTVASLRQLNKFNRQSLYVGQLLTVQASNPLTVSNQVTNQGNAPAKTQKHRIRKGENLGTIAKRYGTTVSLLRKLNQFKGNLLGIGNFLKVPTHVPAQALAKKTHKKKIVHTVKSGDSLWYIAQSYQVSIDKLSQWNRLRKNEFLRLGQKLIIWHDK